LEALLLVENETLQEPLVVRSRDGTLSSSEVQYVEDESVRLPVTQHVVDECLRMIECLQYSGLPAMWSVADASRRKQAQDELYDEQG